MGCAGRGLTTPAEGFVEYARGHRWPRSPAEKNIFICSSNSTASVRHPTRNGGRTHAAHEQEQFRSVHRPGPPLRRYTNYRATALTRSIAVHPLTVPKFFPFQPFPIHRTERRVARAMPVCATKLLFPPFSPLPSRHRVLTASLPTSRTQAVKAKKITKRKQTLKFTIDCSQPVDDGIMDAASFVR